MVYSEVVDLTRSKISHYIYDEEVRFGLIFSDLEFDPITLDTDYFDIKIYEYSYKFVNNVNDKLTRDIGYKQCTSDEMTMPDSITSQILSEFMFCPDKKDYFIRGNLGNYDYNGLEIEIVKCTGKPSCKTDSEIAAYIENVQLILPINSIYLNFDDYEKPIQTWLNDQVLYKFSSKTTHYANIKISENIAELSDSQFFPWESQTKKFYSVDGLDYYNKNSVNSGAFANIIFSLSPKLYHYERVTYNLLDLFGQIGGIYELFYLCGYFVVIFIARKTMMYSIIKELYHFEDEGKETPIQLDKPPVL